MALERQIIPLQFSQGVDSASDPKQLPAPKLLVLQDADFESKGQLTQRQGSIALTASKLAGGSLSSSDDPYFCLPNLDQLAIRARTSMFQKTDVGSGKWAELSIPMGLRYSKSTVLSGLFAGESAGYDEDDNYQLFAAFVNPGSKTLLVRVLDKGSGAVLFSQVYVISPSTAFANPPVLACVLLNGYAHVYAAIGAGIVQKVINLSTFAVTAATFNSGTDYREMSVVAASWLNKIYILYRDDSLNMYLGVITAGSTSISSTSAFPTAGQQKNPYVAVQQGSGGNPDRVLAFHSNNDVPTARLYLSNLTAATGTTVALGTTVSGYTAIQFRANADVAPNSGDMLAYVYKQLSVIGNSLQLGVYAIDPSGVATLQTSTDQIPITNNVQAGFDPFLFKGRKFCPFLQMDANDGILSATGKYVLTRTTGTQKTGDGAAECCFGVGVQLFPIAHSTRVGTSTVTFAGLEKLSRLSSTDSEYRLVRYELSYAPIDHGSFAQHAGTTYIAGASTLAFDGQTVSELGFTSTPTISGSYDATGSLPAGTYQYVGVFEWFDANGNLQRSAPGRVTTVTTVSPGRIQVGDSKPIYVSVASGKSQPVATAVYRTEAGGSVFYRVTTIAPGVVVFDATLDTDLVANETLYTTGGVLDVAPSMPSAAIHVHQKRMLLVTGEDENLVLVSKALEAGTGPEFNEDIGIRFDKGSYGVKAIGSLDEKAVFLKSDMLYYVTGDGPNDLGQNSTYSDPQEINTDAGVSEPRSVLSVPGGLLYKSTRGWYLLDRSLQTRFIGSEVRRFNSLTVTGALLVAKRNQARFFHSDGTTLIFDYITGQWSTASGQAAQSVCEWRGKQTYITANALALYEDPSQWLENATNIEPKATTSWIALGGIQGFQRLYKAIILGELRSRHTLRVRVGFDYDPKWRDEFTIDSNTAQVTTALTDSSYFGSVTASQGTPDAMLQYQIRPYLQKCEAVRFEITILNSQNANAELARISGIALEVGVKRGTKRLNVERVIA